MHKNNIYTVENFICGSLSHITFIDNKGIKYFIHPFDCGYFRSLKEHRKLKLEQIKKALLTYYKVIRRKIRRHQDSLYCECCGMPNWQTDAGLYSKEENKRRKFEFENDLKESEKYLDSIKVLLDTREHVKRKINEAL